MNHVEVLDLGYIELLDTMGDDKTIADSARVSYASAKTRSEDAKLIDHLVRNRHTSPLEMVEFRFEVKAPLFVARQWFRHRTANFNEISGRYSEMQAEFYIPDGDDIRGQGVGKNKQVGDGSLLREVQDYARDVIRKSSEASYLNYAFLLAGGVCREQARMVLPLNLYTRFIYKTDLHNLLHFLKLRLAPDAQEEFRVYARAILAMIEPKVPLAVGSWRKHILKDGTDE